MLGVTREKILDTLLTDYVTNPFEKDFRDCLKDIKDKSQWLECETEVIRNDGSRFFALIQGREIPDAQEVIIFISDISKQKQTESALRESEQKYKEVADLLAEGVFEANANGIVTYANNKILASLQLSENDIKNGIHIFEVIAPQDMLLAKERLGRVLKQEDVGVGEYSLLRRDGTTFPALVHSLAMMREGKVIGVRGLVIDISERKQSEMALQESEKKYRELAELLDAGVFETDTNGIVTYTNRKGLQIFNLDENDFKNGINVFDVIVAQDLDIARNNFISVLKHEDVGPVEYLLKRKDGTTFTGLTYSSAITHDGIVVGVRGVVVDISELKQAEQALKESEGKYRELTDLLDEGVFEMDLDGNFTYANRKGLSYLSIDEPDLISELNVFDIVIPQDVERAKERLTLVISQQDTGPIEFQIMRKDGTTFPVLTHSSAIIRDNVVVGIRGVVFDISEIKKTEQALRESEERFRTLIKSLHEGIWVLDKDDITTFVNPRMAEMLGYKEEEMTGKPVYAFNDEQWMEYTIESLERRKQGVSEQLEGELVHKNGNPVYVLIEASPIFDKDGIYSGSIAGIQDITERKNAENRLKQTMVELDRSNKELEQFAYVTSHDLREPLRMITSFSQSLEKRYKDKLDSNANEYIHFMVDGASRMQRLIDDILVYSRVSTRGQPFELVELDNVLQEVMINLKAAIEETDANIIIDILPTIQADPTQMKQVFQNLIANAIKFHKDGESPIIQISVKKEVGEWLFSVKDNGIGMDPELFGRLFNLFQRLHPPDKYPGTGVGLAVTKKIVQRHGGRIWVESQPGVGSTFYFTIPRKK